jgi:hypothetical protein
MSDKENGSAAGARDAFELSVTGAARCVPPPSSVPASHLQLQQWARPLPSTDAFLLEMMTPEFIEGLRRFGTEHHAVNMPATVVPASSAARMPFNGTLPPITWSQSLAVHPSPGLPSSFMHGGSQHLSQPATATDPAQHVKDVQTLFLFA